MRSWLFVPADSERKIAKALSSPADVVILDLEDSVALKAKPLARELAAQVLQEHKPAEKSGPARQIYVRVNPIESGEQEKDLSGLKGLHPDGFMLPKTNSGEDVKAFAERLTQPCPIIAIATETAASLFCLGSYDNLDAHLAALTWGAEDLSAALGALTPRDESGQLTDPYKLARSLCLAGARKAGVEPIDSVFTDFADLAGLKAEAIAAARDGFTGKMAIHPAQISIINEVFTPSARQIETAKSVIAAFASQPNAGVIALNGKMYDIPHLKQAEQLITRAKRYHLDTK